MADDVLVLKGIEKSFGGAPVLRGIDLEIARGEFLTLLGSSGCGKTTTIRIVAGLETPDRGRVLLNGEDVTQREPWERNVNTVFQNYALFPHMNVEANIGYSLKLKKKSRAEAGQAVKEALKLVQLEGFEKRMPSELSGGQRQRVAIARALVNEPQVLLLDEPLGALDLQLRRQMQTELKRLQKKLGITFIYITHDQEEALNMSDRIAVMRDGRFVQIGPAQEIYDRPRTAYVARFVGNANIIRAGGRLLAVRSEQLLIDRQAAADALPAIVKEKSFVGGMLRIILELSDGTQAVASRHGIDASWQPGEAEVWGVEAAFTLGNYAKMLQPVYRDTFVESVKLALLTTALTLAVGYPFGYFMARLPAKKKSFVMLLVVIPFWTNALMRMYGWMILFRSNGLLEQLLRRLGLIEDSLKLLYNYNAVLAGMVYALLPFMVLAVYSSAEKMDWSLVEAAKDLGAKSWQAFLTITLTLTLPGILSGVILVFIPSMGLFFIADILGGGKIMLVGNLIRDQLMTTRDWPFAAALSVTLMLFTMLFIWTYRRITHSDELEGLL